MSYRGEVVESHTRAQKNSVDVRLGQQIRKLRIMRGYSQDAIAKRIGVTFQQLQKYERGINRVCVSRLVDICKFFAIHPSYFVDNLVEKSDVCGGALSEDSDEFQDESGRGSSIDNKEMLALIRAYKSISSPNIRKKVINLIKSLSDEANND